MDIDSESNTPYHGDLHLDTSELISRFPRALENGVQTLYKFKNFDLKHISDILVRRRLYLPRPSEFNDPWELLPWVTIDLPNVDESDLRKKILDVFQRIRMCCFTADYSNTLLWSHYANQHQGLCIGFDSSIVPLSHAHKVQYSQRYPTIEVRGVDSYTPVNLCSPILTKSAVWSYENEYRLVFAEPHEGEYLDLPDNSIKVVYIGARASIDYQTCIQHLSEIGPFSPKIYRAKIQEDEFALSFHECTWE